MAAGEARKLFDISNIFFSQYLYLGSGDTKYLELLEAALNHFVIFNLARSGAYFHQICLAGNPQHQSFYLLKYLIIIVRAMLRITQNNLKPRKPKSVNRRRKLAF
jgi:hypothetical protein